MEEQRSRILEVPEPEADYSIPGMRIQIFEKHHGKPWRLNVKCGNKQDWIVYKKQKLISCSVKETTIRYNGENFRIFEEENTPNGWTYRLNPWPESEIPFRVVELCQEKILEKKSEIHETQRIHKLAGISWIYDLFLGWLPSEIQNQLSYSWLFCPVNASRKNGLLQFFMSLFFALATFGTFTSYFFMYFSAEGLFRNFIVKKTYKPCGILVLEYSFIGIIKIISRFNKT
jgi:hypothetical protein